MRITPAPLEVICPIGNEPKQPCVPSTPPHTHTTRTRPVKINILECSISSYFHPLCLHRPRYASFRVRSNYHQKRRGAPSISRSPSRDSTPAMHVSRRRYYETEPATKPQIVQIVGFAAGRACPGPLKSGLCWAAGVLLVASWRC